MKRVIVILSMVVCLGIFQQYTFAKFNVTGSTQKTAAHSNIHPMLLERPELAEHVLYIDSNNNHQMDWSEVALTMPKARYEILFKKALKEKILTDVKGNQYVLLTVADLKRSDRNKDKKITSSDPAHHYIYETPLGKQDNRFVLGTAETMESQGDWIFLPGKGNGYPKNIMVSHDEMMYPVRAASE